MISAWVAIARRPNDLLLGVDAALPLAAAILAAFYGQPWPITPMSWLMNSRVSPSLCRNSARRLSTAADIPNAIG